MGAIEDPNGARDDSKLGLPARAHTTATAIEKRSIYTTKIYENEISKYYLQTNGSRLGLDAGRERWTCEVDHSEEELRTGCSGTPIGITTGCIILDNLAKIRENDRG